MLIDRTHRLWLALSVTILAAGMLAYAVNAVQTPDGPRGGSVPGLLFGIAGSAMMIFAGLLAARKRVPTWRIRWWPSSVESSTSTRSR